MQNLINDLLEYSQVTRRGREPETMNCEFILNQALSNLKLMIKDNKATVSHGFLLCNDRFYSAGSGVSESDNQLNKIPQ
jgi:hypothetical protein